MSDVLFLKSENASLRGAAMGLGELCDQLKEEIERMRINERNALRERDQLRAENAKLREFANTMRVTIKDACGVCDEVYCSSYDEEQECCMFDSIARSLGIEVDG